MGSVTSFQGPHFSLEKKKEKQKIEKQRNLKTHVQVREELPHVPSRAGTYPM